LTTSVPEPSKTKKQHSTTKETERALIKEKPSALTPKPEEDKESNTEKEVKEAKIPKWKIQHENFIKNIRFNKQLKEVKF